MSYDNETQVLEGRRIKKRNEKGQTYSEFWLSLHEIVGRVHFCAHISFRDQNLVFRNILNAKDSVFFCRRLISEMIFTAIHGNCIR